MIHNFEVRDSESQRLQSLGTYAGALQLLTLFSMLIGFVPAAIAYLYYVTLARLRLQTRDTLTRFLETPEASSMTQAEEHLLLLLLLHHSARLLLLHDSVSELTTHSR